MESPCSRTSRVTAAHSIQNISKLEFEKLYKNKLLAQHEFETSLEVLPDYYPAKMMLKKLSTK